MAKKHGEEKHEAKKTHVATSKKTHVYVPEKIQVPKKTPVLKTSSGDKSIPSMTEEQTQAYLQFSDVCKEVYEKFSKEKIDTRVTQLKSSPALIAVVRFMVMMHDLLKMYGVMQFNKHVSPVLYKYLNDIQEQTGQTLPLARVLLDGIETTKMELLSGVTVHPLPRFKEPEYKTMSKKTPPPVDPTEEEFEPQDFDPEQTSGPPAEQPQNVGPGGPYMDSTVQPQSGTPVDVPINPPVSIEEEAPSEEPV